jgi:hypothetical protein
MSSDQDQNENQDQATPKSKIKSRSQIDQESGAAPVRRPTPSSILVYVALVIVTYLYSFVVPGEPVLDFGERFAVTIFIRLMIVFLLVNRSTIGWILALLFEASQIVLFPLSFDVPNEPKSWGLIFLHTAAMALLLTRATRQHIFSRDPETTTAERGDHEREDESEEVQADGTPSSSRSSSSSST